MPPAAHRLSASPRLAIVRQGAVRIAATSRTSQKWTIVGVPKACTSGPRTERDSAPRAITTNWRPVHAAAEEPTITENVSQPTDGDSAAASTVDPPLLYLPRRGHRAPPPDVSPLRLPSPI